MTYDDALIALDTRTTALPKGVMGYRARIGHALDSETLAAVSLWSRGSSCFWQAEAEDQQPVGAWTGYAPWISATWGLNTGALIPQTFPGSVLTHKKGNVYLALGMAAYNNDKHGVYAHFDMETGTIDGPWWIRPWSMFTPDRFALTTRIKTWPLS